MQTSIQFRHFMYSKRTPVWNKTVDTWWARADIKAFITCLATELQSKLKEIICANNLHKSNSWCAQIANVLWQMQGFHETLPMFSQTSLQLPSRLENGWIACFVIYIFILQTMLLLEDNSGQKWLGILQLLQELSNTAVIIRTIHRLLWVWRKIFAICCKNFYVQLAVTFVYISLFAYWLVITCEMPTWHHTRCGIKKSVLCVNAHFSSSSLTRIHWCFPAMCCARII